MGVFLATPLMAELEACTEDNPRNADCRRVLEMLVPLVYRPAMKVTDLPYPPTHSQSTSTLPAQDVHLLPPLCMSWQQMLGQLRL